ncbi:Plant disease resistance response protein [Corchorus olitorius]|uniref:Dirigent protein n=1 Tax=Corchorus olitorius TaxID=93759 RepID=A0A1R3JDE8_9ROSI|nr:Plant disease resistance response protein [Corchorus olitorius]
MEKGSFISRILVLSLAISPVFSQYYSKTEPYTPQPEKITNLHFFFHDTLSGKDPSAVLVARANITDDDDSPTPFSSVIALDDPLTLGPDLNSGVIGNAQGLYVSSGKDIPSLVAFFDFGFTQGEFNGSSISVFSRNPILENERELAVVGGRGKFRMARGVAQLKTFFLNVTNGDVIVEYNVTVIHY